MEQKKSIVFLLPGTEVRSKPLNGDTIRYGGAACSGTDQSVIIVAEGLAKRGWDVTIILESTDMQTVNGVNYTNFKFDGMHDREIDVLVVTLWFSNPNPPECSSYEELPFSVKEAVIHWQHMAWLYATEQMREYLRKNDHLSVAVVSPSAWAQEKAYHSIHALSEDTRNITAEVIPNPLMLDIVEEVEREFDGNKRELSTIFPVQSSRGGLIADQVVEELGWPPMNRHNYLYQDIALDKKELFKRMFESEYFIYPACYDDYSILLKDTFGCGVAEAAACGVITLTYAVGGIKEHFSDACIFVDFPNGCDINDEEDKIAIEKLECFKDVSNFKNALEFLESNPNLKDTFRSKAKDVVRRKLDPVVIVDRWADLLTRLARN